MNRRHFIKNTCLAAPLVLAFNPVSFGQKRFLENLIIEEKYKDRILVLIQLNGGNDGLNTVIPVDKYDILSVARKNILIPENKVLKLNDSSIFGFHPAMTALQRLYHDKRITVVQGVGYPEPEFSHFRGINIKYTANTDKDEGRSGWLGRYLEQEYAGYPQGYPVHPTDGPLAFRIGMVSPRIVQGPEVDYSVGITDIESFNYTSNNTDTTPLSDDEAGKDIDLIRSISKRIDTYAPIIQKFAKRQENLSKLYPEAGNNKLADQLKMVAKLIGSGLNTQIYIVCQSGYDTHGDQVEQSDSTLGLHATLLKNLSDAIAAFQDDIALMGKEDKVMGMTFSEFGRRIASPGRGTDHGTAESVIMFGAKLKGGIIGGSPTLPAVVSVDDNLPVQCDFRSLYASVLKDWFGLSEEMLKKIMSQAPPQRLDLFRA